MRRHTWYLVIVAAFAVVTAFAGLAAPGSITQAPPAPSTPERSLAGTPAGATPAAISGDLYDAILPEYRGEIASATSGRLPVYTIDATLTPPTDGELARISGTVNLTYINTTGKRIDELPIRLNPNLRQYEAGRMTLGRVAVDGTDVTPQAPSLHAVPASTPVATPTVAEADLILARVPLVTPLAQGEAVTVTLEFTTRVPSAPPDGTGIFRYHDDRGAWTLSGWYPILAGYDPETGWDLDPPAAWSDITFANAALYDVTITAPSDLTLVAPGTETDAVTRQGTQERRFVSGPARDFPLIADPTLVETSKMIDGTTVTIHHQPESAQGAEQVLAWASQAMEIFSARFGPYPYAALDIVSVPETVGYEFPQVIWLGDSYIASPQAAGSRPDATEMLVAHEIAHQWWYGLVGSNPHRHAFLDEGLAEYSAIVYFEEANGADAARRQSGEALTLPYASMLVTEGDAIADQPTVAFPDALTYYTTTYRKAALGFAEIRNEIGDEAFFAALRRYTEGAEFEVATPSDLLGAFEATANRDLDAIWQLWFQTASGRVEIIMEPAVAPPIASPGA